MTYLKYDNNNITYPYTIQLLKNEYPHTSFPNEISSSLLAEYNVYTVLNTQKPDCNQLTEDVIELAPALISDVWTQQWQVITVSSEIAESRIQAVRDEMSCTPRQARLILQQMNLLEAVETWITTSDAATKIEWNFAQEIKRTWPPLIACAIALNLTDSNLDDMFIAANLL